MEGLCFTHAGFKRLAKTRSVGTEPSARSTIMNMRAHCTITTVEYDIPTNHAKRIFLIVPCFPFVFLDLMGIW